jgi:hypothetical protein
VVAAAAVEVPSASMAGTANQAILVNKVSPANLEGATTVATVAKAGMAGRLAPAANGG